MQRRAWARPVETDGTGGDSVTGVNTVGSWVQFVSGRSPTTFRQGEEQPTGGF